MNTDTDLGRKLGAELEKARIAYIKPTGSDEAHRLGLIPANVDLPDGMKLYVLHSFDGSVLGFTDAYDTAYGAALQNELTPVSVH
jgi:hypothetical protein